MQVATATGQCVVNITNIALATHCTWYFLPYILMIPNGSNKPEHIAVFSQIIELLIEAEKLANDRHNDNKQEKIDDELDIYFSERLASYLFSIQESNARQILNIILTQIKDAVDLASTLLLNITWTAERQKTFERYWLFWSWFAKTLLPYATEPKALYKYRSYYSYDSDIVRSLLFMSVPWQGVEVEIQMFQLGVKPIIEFVRTVGTNPVVYSAIIRLIYYFPELFKPIELIEDLVNFQEQTEMNLLTDSNTVFCLERIFHRLLVQNREPKPLSKLLRIACLTLLDAMVETSSSQAYFLREHLLQLK